MPVSGYPYCNRFLCGRQVRIVENVCCEKGSANRTKHGKHLNIIMRKSILAPIVLILGSESNYYAPKTSIMDGTAPHTERVVVDVEHKRQPSSQSQESEQGEELSPPALETNKYIVKEFESPSCGNVALQAVEAEEKGCSNSYERSEVPSSVEATSEGVKDELEKRCDVHMDVEVDSEEDVADEAFRENKDESDDDDDALLGGHDVEIEAVQHNLTPVSTEKQRHGSLFDLEKVKKSAALPQRTRRLPNVKRSHRQMSKQGTCAVSLDTQKQHLLS